MKLNEKLLLLVIIFWIFNLPFILGRFFRLNYGLPEIPYQPFIFLGIPATLILYRVFSLRKYKFPYFKYFILVILPFSFIEFYNRPFYETNFEFVKQLSLTYLFFILIINISRKKIIIKYIYKYTLISIFINVMLNTLWHLGVINMANGNTFVLSQDGYISRFGLGGVIQPNGLALTGAMAVLLLLISRKESILKLSTLRNRLLIVFFISPIILNASRGSTLILSLTLLVFVFYQRKIISFKEKVIGLFLFLLFSLSLSLKTFFLKANLVYRFTSETSLEEARMQQIYNSLNNFYDNIFTGVGWGYAANGKDISDIFTSNFLYTQLLGSSGIFIFIFFIMFQYKLFGFFNIKNKDVKVVLFSFFGFFPWMFYNLSLTFPLSIIAVLCFYNKEKFFLIK